MKTIAIIPARYASSRFPGKPLALLGGCTVIERVWRRAAAILGDDNVYVATDDSRIYNVVSAFGNAVMTSADHRSGTDRCREAAGIIGRSRQFDTVLNIQGDEPFVAAGQIRALMACFDDPQVQIASLARPVDAYANFDTLADPNVVKVVMNRYGDAMYFSRAVIPYVRSSEPATWPSAHGFYTHVGVYGYRSDVLEAITALPAGALEKAESLEQLRWLAAGYNIRMAITTEPSIGIDTPADLAAAARYLLSHPQL